MENLWQVGPFYLIRSEYEIPGEFQPPALTSRFKCKDRRINLRTVRDSNTQFNERICEVAQSALQYIVDTFGSNGKIALELDVVPPNHRLLRKKSSLGAKPKLTLGIATFDDPDLTLANVATLVAHESFHALLVRLGPNSNAGDEYGARYFGMCGELIATGKIMKDRIPRQFASDDEFLASSASAATAVNREIIALFQSESLSAGSDGANLILEQCHRLATLPGRAASSESNP